MGLQIAKLLFQEMEGDAETLSPHSVWFSSEASLACDRGLRRDFGTGFAPAWDSGTKNYLHNGNHLGDHTAGSSLACASAMTSDLGGKPHVPLLSGLKQPRPVKLPLKARSFLSFDISQTSPSLCRLQLLVLLRRRACNEFEMSELCCPGESINIVNSQLAPQEAPAPTLLRTIAHTGSHFVLEIPSPIPGIRFALSAHETGIPI